MVISHILTMCGLQARIKKFECEFFFKGGLAEASCGFSDNPKSTHEYPTSLSSSFINEATRDCLKEETFG